MSLKIKNKHLNTKLGKYQYLLKNDEINKYLPETLKANEESINKLLTEHRMVYVKPNLGTGGQGVIKVEKVEIGGRQQYRYYYDNQSMTFNSYAEMYQSLSKKISHKTYLVQKGIHLLKFHKRRFDTRVMVQQNPQGNWEVTGIIGRLAHPKKIVTNYHNGGTPLPMEVLLKPFIKKEKQEVFLHSLKKLAYQTSKFMHIGYPKYRSIGVDVALDRQLNPWILEVNTKPDLYIFKRLKDKSVFRKIYRYAKTKT